MATEPLRASEAARRLEIPTMDPLRLARNGQLRYKMVGGIARIPEDALDEYRVSPSYLDRCDRQPAIIVSRRRWRR